MEKLPPLRSHEAEEWTLYIRRGAHLAVGRPAFRPASRRPRGTAWRWRRLVRHPHTASVSRNSGPAGSCGVDWEVAAQARLAHLLSSPDFSGFLASRGRVVLLSHLPTSCRRPSPLPSPRPTCRDHWGFRPFPLVALSPDAACAVHRPRPIPPTPGRLRVASELGS